MSKRLFFCFLIGCAMFFAACKKDNKTQPPVITINTPYTGQIYDVYDTIYFNTHITCDHNLTKVTYELTDLNLAPVQQAVTLSVSSSDINFSKWYVIDNIHLTNGDYYLAISATDGSKQANAYRKIYIHEAPKRRTGICVVGKNSTQPQQIHIWKVDSVYYPVYITTLSGDYSSASINSYYQQYNVAGNVTGGVNVVGFDNNAIKWSLAPGVGSFPYYTGIYSTGDETFVSYYNNKIIMYDHNGVQKATYTTYSPYYPLKTFVQGDYLIAEEKSISSSSEKLVTYYVSSGVSFQEMPLSHNIVSFGTKDADHVYIMGNNSTNGVIDIFSISTNSSYVPHTLPAGKILSAARIDSNTYMIGYDNNIIYKYQYSNNSLTTYLSGVQATQMQYDSLNNELIIGDINQVSGYNYPNATLINTANVNDSIMDMEVLYNK